MNECARRLAWEDYPMPKIPPVMAFDSKIKNAKAQALKIG